MNASAASLLRLGLLASIALGLAGCGGETCKPTAVTYCTLGNVFWVDSCGDLSELKQTCQNGCNAAATDCATVCTPTCAGKCAGPDGCGGTCSNDCTAGQTCNQTSQRCEEVGCTTHAECVAAHGASWFCSPLTFTCDCNTVAGCVGMCGGPNGCGGTCPDACQAGQFCNQATFVCESDDCATDNECSAAHGANWFCNPATSACECNAAAGCAGRCGGSDGCGGACPDTCQAGQFCNQATFTCEAVGCTTHAECVADHDANWYCNPMSFQCECLPAALCAGACCLPGQTCNAGSGQCLSCTPDCAGKQCGDDGCGGSCGSCQAGQFCQDGGCQWLCNVSTCPDGCCLGTSCMPGTGTGACGSGGDVCDTCQAGETCISGACGVATDPCDGVPFEGRCTSSTAMEFCVDPGNGQLYVNTFTCAQGTACQIVGGSAQCVVTANCVEGATNCLDANRLQVCQGGNWVTSTCAAGCLENPLGDACAADGAFVARTLTFQYEARGPNAGWTDWGEPVLTPAGYFLLISGTYTADESTVHDAQITDASGTATVQVPSNAGADEWIILLTAGLRSDGELAFVVADPGLGAGTANPGDLGAEPRVWSWALPAQGLADTSAWTLPVDSGSGAARVFDYLRYIYSSSENRWTGTQPGPIVVWLGMDLEWSCGACFGPWPASGFGINFDSQVWMAGGADQGYWSDAVTTHELGHWAMSTFGSSPGEGGPHCLGVPTLPGQAWSEGWATWFSADARDYPVYYDKQGGGFFWLDLASRLYAGGTAWQRPLPYLGLMQLLDENEVSAMMWGLSKVQGLGRAPLDAALASARLVSSPFARGYYRHIWEVDGGCNQINVQETNQPAPFFADFLDALRCAGVSAANIDAATQPNQHYPYPSNAPLCNRTESPFSLGWTVERGTPAAGAALGLKLRLTRRGFWPAPVSIRFALPEGVVATKGSLVLELPAGDRVGEREFPLELSLSRVPDKDLLAVVDSNLPGAGYHAAIPYRFGRPAPRSAEALALGPRVVAGAHAFGRAVLLRK